MKVFTPAKIDEIANRLLDVQKISANVPEAVMTLALLVKENAAYTAAVENTMKKVLAEALGGKASATEASAPAADAATTVEGDAPAAEAPAPVAEASAPAPAAPPEPAPTDDLEAGDWVMAGIPRDENDARPTPKRRRR